MPRHQPLYSLDELPLFLANWVLNHPDERNSFEMTKELLSVYPGLESDDFPTLLIDAAALLGDAIEWLRKVEPSK